MSLRDIDMGDSNAISRDRVGDASISKVIANFICGLGFKSIPSEVIDRAHIAFIDTVGVMLAGSKDRASLIACDIVKAESSAPIAGIVGQPFRASVQLAAFANGVAAHTLEFDLTYISGQSVAAIIPAILPLAESTNATPSECVVAFVVGCELAARILRACPKLSANGAWHTAGVVGTIAAAAACSRLLNLSADDASNVIGMSTSMASGTTANYGTMTKSLHAGLAARNGILAALLGAHGFSANPSALEASDGFFHAFCRGLELSYAPFRDLGDCFNLMDPGYKLKAYPCGGLTHSAIEAALAIRARIRGRIDEISAIHISVTSRAALRIGAPYPDDVEAAKFSGRYLVSYTLLHGEPRLSAFTEEAVHASAVRDLASKISIDSDIDATSDAESPARLTVILRDGAVLVERVDHVSGSLRQPMSLTAIADKFLDCAGRVTTRERADEILALLGSLAGRSSFGDFWKLIVRT